MDNASFFKTTISEPVKVKKEKFNVAAIKEGVPFKLSELKYQQFQPMEMVDSDDYSYIKIEGDQGCHDYYLHFYKEGDEYYYICQSEDYPLRTEKIDENINKFNWIGFSCYYLERDVIKETEVEFLVQNKDYTLNYLIEETVYISSCVNKKYKMFVTAAKRILSKEDFDDVVISRVRSMCKDYLKEISAGSVAYTAEKYNTYLPVWAKLFEL